MKIMKILLIAGLVSIMTTICAFASEIEAATNDSETESNQEEIQADVQDNSDILQDVLTENLEESTEKKGMVIVNILNVRSGPSTDTEKLGKLSLGEIVEIQAEVEDWYEISYESNVAYICAEYVRVIDLIDSEDAGTCIVEYAKQYLGTPYVSGGNTASGFDCSGYVQYVMSNFGIEMPRSSTEQYSIGTRVDKSELLPGDLVYFKYSANSDRLGHVGIYVGDGNFIHSTVPGQTVKISPLNTGYFSYYYYGATRVLQ
jgi:N-acetylmuramoyl-L-alanine amidase